MGISPCQMNFSEESGYIICWPNYSIAGEFNVLRWSCVNCHADGERIPSTFNNINSSSTAPMILVIPRVVWAVMVILSTAKATIAQWVWVMLIRMPGSVLFTKIAITMEGASISQSNHVQIPAISPILDSHANECHNDVSIVQDVSGTSVLSPIYGKDVHLDKKSCTDCHGGLTSINPSPSCTNCHPTEQFKSRNCSWFHRYEVSFQQEDSSLWSLP